MESFLASLLGAIIGGFVALLGVYAAYRLDLRRQQQEERQAIRGLLQGLLTELDACWSRANLTTNPALENLPAGQPFLYPVFIETDFFTLYQANAHLIGRVPDDDLRVGIVKAYTRYKALVETFNVNTRYLLSWQASQHQAETAVTMEIAAYYRRKAIQEHNTLSGWATSLKQDYAALKQELEALFPALRNAITDLE